MLSRYHDDPSINRHWAYYQAVARREQAKAIRRVVRGTGRWLYQGLRRLGAAPRGRGPDSA